ncbi:hemin uptake protein HemP [Pseudoduganella namucuonensis]|uniref:Hemin uptake protein HemP n=1 Tax=Pseudoduganella namucuonensis TaxID=1035707 RepID=A0A1I7IUA9_9BURK|nr:hemin uptake protein HemP [Pseudoduganella namucuonensis]SFU76472.1 Hemin uptake protein HemP [Pseudoduganella namucuonensis]
MHTEKNPAIAGMPAAPSRAAATPAPAVRRLTSAGLMQDQREVEIEHGNKIYRLRITQLGKLILTA